MQENVGIERVNGAHRSIKIDLRLGFSEEFINLIIDGNRFNETE